MTHNFDLIIVGGGPAGLCAAMYAGRGMLNAVLLERGITGGELLNTEKIEDYPGFITVGGPELAEKMTEHAKAFGADIRMETVDGIYREPDGTFRAECASGEVYRAPTPDGGRGQGEGGMVNRRSDPAPQPSPFEGDRGFLLRQARLAKGRPPYDSQRSFEVHRRHPGLAARANGHL